MLTSSHKKDVLIIEDSNAAGIALAEFLRKLDYQNIHVCKDGTSGIKRFQELVRSNIVPIVFLDYYLPDMNADNVLKGILETHPDTQVIIETVAEQSERGIQRLFTLGARHYFPKPYKFEKLKEIMNTVEAAA